ncbi:MAG: lysophospholipase [Ruminiclostridium sp.]|nr:lysophospholipase [Ruminiclostridium sp.]
MFVFKDFTFPSSSGMNTIHARMCLPDSEPSGVVQIAHGIAEHIERYDGFMEFLAEHGFVVVGNDHLGHGSSYTAPGDRGFFSEQDGWTHVVDDMNILYDIMRADYPDIPYIFFGHSMGSFLTRTFLIRYPDKPDLAILCGTGHQPRAAAAGGLALANSAVKIYGPRKDGIKLNSIAFGSYTKRYDDPRTPYDWLSRDPEIVNAYIEDPQCGFIPSVGLFRDMMSGIMFITDPANIAKMNKELPVLFISGWEDPVGDYGKGVKRAFSAFRRAGMKHIHIKLYPGARHELLNELNKEDVMNDIIFWLEKNLSKQQLPLSD